MPLSTELISQFVKITNDKTEIKKESIVYGTIKERDDRLWVQIDGSDQLTPVDSTADMKAGERVTVMIKNHTATVTGNITSPSASSKVVQVMSEEVKDASKQISEFEILIADKVSTEQLNAEKARIDTLVADNATIKGKVEVNEADIVNLKAKDATIEEKLTTNEADIKYLKANMIGAEYVDSHFVSTEELDATNAEIHNLEATYAEFAKQTTDDLTAKQAAINDLEAKKLSSESAALTYANIDFSNIGEAAMEYFYAHSGLIENVTISEGTITGSLIGVTIKGDIIEGNTIVADKLVIQGEDGLYYKLNTDGVTTGAEQTEYNSLNGQVIMAKSITAEQVSVDDLVAFDATIGGFHITENSIYSEVKDDDGNSTRGIYMDADGQINFGDETNYIKYYRDDEGNYRLVVSAESIMYALNGKQYSIADLGQIGDYIHIGTYENEPCIELGEGDSDFKLIITNTRIMFMEGADVPAYINNQSLHIKKAVIEEELQQGSFVWKIRSNGNMGLVWKGDT